MPALAAGLDDYFHLYNYERPHQSLDYQVPADVHFTVKDLYYDKLSDLSLPDLWS